MNYWTWHERGTKKISESPTGIKPMTSWFMSETQIFSLSHARVWWCSIIHLSHFITELKIHILHLLITNHVTVFNSINLLVAYDKNSNLLVPVVQRMDNAIYRINSYPVCKIQVYLFCLLFVFSFACSYWFIVIFVLLFSFLC